MTQPQETQQQSAPSPESPKLNAAATDIRFYHLERSSLFQVLPALLHKASQSGKNIVVQTGAPAISKKISDHLWTFDALSFMPHGTPRDSFAAQQPIYITHEDSVPNDAKIMIAVDGAHVEPARASGFDLCCFLFDGNDHDSLTDARVRWKQYGDNDALSLTYWQQTDQGWMKKA